MIESAFKSNQAKNKCQNASTAKSSSLGLQKDFLLYRIGQDILSAKVGDRLALRFEIQDKLNSPYEIFVRELIASDGIDASEILLIDSIGCPTDYSIMNVLEEVNGSGQTLQANFEAFKFPTSSLVQFRALVTPCIPRYVSRKLR